MIDDNSNPRERGYWQVSELAEAAKLSGGRIRQLLLAGDIKGNKAGQVWTIPYREGLRWLESRSQE